jgi:cellulose biosynthesis protein BcsQ
MGAVAELPADEYGGARGGTSSRSTSLASVSRLSEQYDVVIIDTPPMLGSDETRALTGLASATLLVVSAGRPAAQVASSVAALATTRARLVGVVANRVAPSQVPNPYALVRTQREVARDRIDAPRAPTEVDEPGSAAGNGPRRGPLPHAEEGPVTPRGARTGP